MNLGLLRYSPLFGQKTGVFKVVWLPVIRLKKMPVGETKTIGVDETDAYCAWVGEAKAGTAGEHPIKE